MSNPFNVNLGSGWSVQPGNSNSPFPSTPFIPPRGAEVHYQPNSSSNYYAGGYSQGKNTGVYAGFKLKFWLRFPPYYQILAFTTVIHTFIQILADLVEGGIVSNAYLLFCIDCCWMHSFSLDFDG